MLENGDWLVDAGMPLDKFQKHFKQDLKSRAHTLSGYIVESLQRIPSRGERFFLGTLDCRVEAASSSRVEKIIIQRQKP
jgi:CBS domain containing-hemolysin-like protein